MRVVLLTAYHGDVGCLVSAADSILPQLGSDDLWVIVLDNLSLELPFEVDRRVIVLGYDGDRGAGRARNYGLNYIQENITIFPYALWPIDGDDQLKSGAVRTVRDVVVNSNEGVYAFSYEKVTPNAKNTISAPDGVFNLTDQLRDYRTPCGSTVVVVADRTFLDNVRFGVRMRANDQLFFLSACDLHSGGVYRQEVILQYNVGFQKTLSSNKLKMPYYKFLALKDFGLSYPAVAYFFIFYAFKNIARRIKW